MIHSMTAFASQQKKYPWGSLNWEIKSVNHRYFDISFRLPEVVRDLEFTLRDIARGKLQRGKIECVLKLQWADQEAAKIVLNETLLDHLISTTEQVAARLEKSASINPMHLLTWPGVVAQSQQDEDSLREAVLSLFKETLTSFIECRRTEGAALAQTILERLKGMGELTSLVADTVPSILQAQRQKVIDRIQEITQEIDQTRLEQELVYFSQKMDVAEELDRLLMHIKEMERILVSGGFVGRRLDFLSQEMNREANTVGSKSQHTSTSHASVDLKVLIEQIREQVQNIE